MIVKEYLTAVNPVGICLATKDGEAHFEYGNKYHVEINEEENYFSIEHERGIYKTAIIFAPWKLVQDVFNYDITKYVDTAREKLENGILHEEDNILQEIK